MVCEAHAGSEAPPAAQAANRGRAYLIWLLGDQSLAKPCQLRFHGEHGQPTQVSQSISVVIAVFDLNAQVPVVLLVLLCQVQCFFPAPSTAQHRDGVGDVKRDVRVALATALNELLKLVPFLELGVAIEQQGGVIGGGTLLAVHRFQVRGEIGDELRIQELANHVAGLHVSAARPSAKRATPPTRGHQTYPMVSMNC